MNKLITIIGLEIFLCAILLGCGQAQIRKHVSNNIQLEKGEKLDLVYRDPSLVFERRNGLIVKKTTIKVPENDEVSGKSVAMVISEELYREIKDAGLFKDVKKWDEDAPPGYLVLETCLTELDPGSGAARYFIGFGAGSSTIQVEGTIVNPTSNKTVFAYVDRRAGWIGVFGGRSRSLILDDAVVHAKDVVVELKSN